MNKPQIIYDKNGPAFVVLAIDDFLALSPKAEEMLSDEEAFDLAQARDDGTRVPHNVVKRLIDGENPIKVYREWRDLTQEALAAKAGVSVGYVSQIERGTRNPSRKKLLELAEIFGVSLDDLTTS